MNKSLTLYVIILLWIHTPKYQSLKYVLTVFNVFQILGYKICILKLK